MRPSHHRKRLLLAVAISRAALARGGDRGRLRAASKRRITHINLCVRKTTFPGRNFLCAWLPRAHSDNLGTEILRDSPRLADHFEIIEPSCHEFPVAQAHQRHHCETDHEYLLLHNDTFILLLWFDFRIAAPAEHADAERQMGFVRFDSDVRMDV